MSGRTATSSHKLAASNKGHLTHGVLTFTLGILTFAVHSFSGSTLVRGRVLSEAAADFTLSGSNSVANQDGNILNFGQDKIWIGNGQNASASYLGLNFTGGSIPADAQIKSASVEFTAVGDWINLSVLIFGNTHPISSFRAPEKLSSYPLTSAYRTFSDNVKWDSGKTYSYDVTEPVRELFSAGFTNSLSLIIKGTGSSWARKYIYGNPSTGKSPKLHVTYVTASVVPTPTTGVSPVSTPTSAPVLPTNTPTTPTATPVPPTAIPTATSAPVPSPTPMPDMTMSTPTAVPPMDSIYGQVSTDLLGNCSATVHDRYVTRGPDTRLYRTWHPQTVPVDSTNPGGARCTFAHEHGDDPSTSNIFAGSVPFNYIAAVAGMDEPHVGFKCFVHNAGTRNDEGTVALHNSYYCFHMGTGGAARFTTRFHSLDFHVVTNRGARMDLQGLADIGNVGTICDNPRQQRTVMGYGCRLDSAYEIWENRLTINNQGNVVASAITSTAVFDPITVMDPADKSRLVYTWDSSTYPSIFKFNDTRSNYRGCDREAYSGPLSWYNSRGGQVYYTDVYGNVANGGPLRQVVSVVDNRNAGALDQYGGLIMGYKGGDTGVPQSQFKYHRSTCASGLGIKN